MESVRKMGIVRLRNVREWDTGELVDILVRSRHHSLDGRTVDCTGLSIAPGFVDMHVHFNDPGHLEREDMHTGSAAASKGGYTDVALLPDTDPAADGHEFQGTPPVNQLRGFSSVLDYLERYGKEFDPNQPIDYVLVAAASLGREGKRSNDPQNWEPYLRGGAYERGYGHPVVALSDDGRMISDATLEHVMQYAADDGIVVMDHPQRIEHGTVNKGEISRRLGIAGNPDSAEIDAVRRDIECARRTGARLHLSHLSTEGALDLVRQAKDEGLPVTCDTAPHYFALTEKDLERYGSRGKVNPPLRSASDRRAVLAAIADGTVDAISCNHTPLTHEEKEGNTFEAQDGISGLETCYGLCETVLVKTGLIHETQLIQMMSLAPARILGIERSRLPEMLARSEGPLKGAKGSTARKDAMVAANDAREEASAADASSPAASQAKEGGRGKSVPPARGAKAANRVLDLTVSRNRHVNFSLVAPDQEWTVDAERFLSKGHNTPFDGWKLTGLPVATIVHSRLHDVGRQIRLRAEEGRWI